MMHAINKIIVYIFLAELGKTLAQDDTYRLPPNYEIKHYDIDLTLPENLFTADSNDYQGNVKIHFQVLVNTYEVKLHSSHDNIKLLSVQFGDEEAMNSSSYSVNETTDILTISLDSQLVIGTDYTLNIAFNASLIDDDITGFYKTSYTDEDGLTQYIAATQLEPTYARYAFPCFDEPAYKATFDCKLTYPSDMKAWSNTLQVSSRTDPERNLTTTEFRTTPIMPVYLVAFLVSKYTCNEGILEGNSELKYQVCSVPEQKSARAFAVDLIPKVLDKLNAFTGRNYSIDMAKLDVIAVTGRTNAMENWGVPFYSEDTLLFNKSLDSVILKQNVATLISHELSHQWFGNLVTCKWWSETFINEGFGKLFEYYTTGWVLPSFEMEKQFVVAVLQSIMLADGDRSQGVPALRANASTPDQIKSKFDSYTYDKGSSVYRMIEHVLGRNQFMKGLQTYLKDNKYQSAEPVNLWNALETVVDQSISKLPNGVNISDIMENWITNPGFPVVNVTLNCKDIHISQQEFNFKENFTANTTWYIPISYTSSKENDYNKDTSPKGWITPTADLTLEGILDENSWIVINNQQTGYFKVNYDTTLWNNLATALRQTNFSGIHPTNRAQIIDDLFTLAEAGFISFTEAFAYLEFLENDTSYFSWYPAVTGFWYYLLTKTGLTSKLGVAVASHFLRLSNSTILSHPLTKIDDENQIYTLNQEMMNRYTCRFGNTDCITNAKSLFETYKTTFERCPKDEARLLSKIINNDPAITPEDYNDIFTSIIDSSDIGVDTALHFFIDKFHDLLNKYNDGGETADDVLEEFGDRFTKQSQIEKLQDFINTGVLTGTLLTSANDAIETATSNQAELARHKDDLYAYYGLEDDSESSS